MRTQKIEYFQGYNTLDKQGLDRWDCPVQGYETSEGHIISMDVGGLYKLMSESKNGAIGTRISDPSTLKKINKDILITEILANQEERDSDPFTPVEDFD